MIRARMSQVLRAEEGLIERDNVVTAHAIAALTKKASQI